MNTIKTTKTIFLLAGILLCANAGAQNSIPENQKIIAFGISDKEGGVLGLEFSPPEGEGWNIKRSGTGVSVKKNGASADENSEIEGYRNYIFGARAGPDVCFTHLAHEIAHAAQLLRFNLVDNQRVQFVQW